MRRLPLPLTPLAALALLALASFPSRAAWLPNGTPVAPHPSHQVWPAVAPDGAGGAYVAWVDTRNNPPGTPLWAQETDLYLQRVTATGAAAPGWPADGVPVCVAPGYQAPNGDLAVIADGAGGVLVLWGDGRPYPSGVDLCLQRMTGSGAPAPGWPVNGIAVCSANDTQDGAQLVADGSGGAFVVWRDQRKGDANDHDIYAQHVTGAGAIAPGWPVDGLALDASTAANEDPTLLEDGLGGAFFAYSRDASGTFNQFSLVVKRLDAAGATAAGWPAGGRVACSGTGARIHPRMVTDGAGGLVVAWADTRSDVSGDLYAARVLASGLLDAGWPVNGRAIAVAPGYQGPPELVSNLAGGAIVAWSDNRAGAYRIYAQHVLSNGAIAAGWPASGLLACLAPAAQMLGGIVSDGMGGAYLAYMGSGGIVAQHLAPWGTPAPGWLDLGAQLDTVSIGFVDPRLCATPDGGAIVVWPGDRGPIPNPYSPPNPYDLYATRLGGDGPVPALASLVSAERSGRVATLVWQLRGVPAGLATVERRVDAGEWTPLAEVSGDGHDRYRYEDATLAPGHAYAYRLAYTYEGARAYAPEALIEVPAAALAIDRVTVADGALELAVSLATDEPARLELFDVTGRRVGGADLGAPGAGEHAVRLDRGAAGPGLLFARLRQGNAHVVGKAVVVK